MEVSKTLKSAIAAITGQLTSLKDELADVNRQLGLIGIQIQELRAKPVSLSDYGQYIKDRIEHAADKHASMLEWEMFRDAPSIGASPKNREPFGTLEDGLNSDSPMFTAGMFGGGGGALSINAACFFFGEQMYEGFITRAQAKFGARWGNEGMPRVEERRKIIADLDARRNALIEKRGSLEAEIDKITGALMA